MKKKFTFIFSLIIVLAFTGKAIAFNGNPGKSVPAPAVLISPGNGHNVSPDWLSLEWQAGSGPVQYGYRVYFGETNPPTTQVYNGNNTYYSPQNLEYEKEYFWMVVPYNGNGDAENVPVWSFSTNVLVPIYYDPFFNPEAWIVENLSGSPFSWVVEPLGARIYTYVSDEEGDDEDGDLIDKSNVTHVWSTLTSPAIDISGRENIYFFLEYNIDTYFLDPEYEEYFVSAQISTDNSIWHEVVRIEVNNQNQNRRWFGPVGDIEEFYISDIVDGHDQIWIRLEFKSLIEAQMGWAIEDFMLFASPLQGIPGPVSNPEPHEGQNTSWFTLRWEPPVEPVPDGFRVYFGENESPDSLVYHGTNSYFDPQGNLGQLNRRYYWKVIPYNSFGEPDDVPVWSFTTYDLSTVWIETFEEETIDWVVDNHSGSDHEWQFITVQEWGQTRYYAQIEVPAENDENILVWSSVTSPSIDLTGHQYVHLDFRSIFLHQNEFDAYNARILVGVDDEEWVEVKKYEGAIPWAEEEGGAYESFHANISQIADDHENVKIRLEFKNNGDKDFCWRVFWVEVKSIGAQVPGAANLISPEDGAENQPVTVNLEWQQGEGMTARGYRLYMDTSNPPETLVAEGDFTTFSMEDLDFNTEYFWMVVPYNTIGDAESVAVWSFSTEVDATSITEPLATGLQIFPNPAGSQLQVVAADIIQEVRIFNQLGQMVYSATVNSVHGRINVGHLREGVYLLQVKTQKGVSTHKVQIAR
jgi:hypothetical protein